MSPYRITAATLAAMLTLGVVTANPAAAATPRAGNTTSRPPRSR